MNSITYVLIFFLLVYSFTPVPNCTKIPASELVDEAPDTIYSEDRINDVKNDLDLNGFIVIQIGRASCRERV